MRYCRGITISTTVSIDCSDCGMITLRVGRQGWSGIVAQFFGDRKSSFLRKPFREYSFNTALGTSRGSLKVTGERVVELAVALGLPSDKARAVVNEALVYLGWPEIPASEGVDVMVERTGGGVACR